jgi:N-methylhydantoinase A
VEATIGGPLSLAPAVAAYGISEIVDENMANAARVHAVERGLVAADRVLVAFGGAAPLHAARLAEKLGIRRVVIPPDAGVGSAVGFLRAPAAYELVRSRYMRLDRFDLAEANALLAEMSREARALVASAAGGQTLAERRLCFMRYLGQGHEISITLPDRDLADHDPAELRARFEAEYDRQFERHIPGAALEVLSWAVRVGTADAAAARVPDVAPQAGPAPIGRRAVVLDDRATPVDVAVYARADFAPGGTVNGPALVVEQGTSTFVTAAFRVSLDGGGALVLERDEEGERA